MIVCAVDTRFSSKVTSSGAHRKYDRVGARSDVMLSTNDIAHADALIREIRARLGYSRPLSLPNLLERLGEARAAVIRKLTEECMPSGLGLDRFWAKGRKLLPPKPYARVFNRVDKVRLKCDLLLVGFDLDGEAHIVSVGDDAPATRDREVFCAIGTGGVLADSILSAYDHSANVGWRETAYRVMAAKKAALRAEGVGEITLLTAVNSRGTWILEYHSRVINALIEEYGVLPPQKRWSEMLPKLARLKLAQAQAKLVPWKP